MRSDHWLRRRARRFAKNSDASSRSIRDQLLWASEYNKSDSATYEKTKVGTYTGSRRHQYALPSNLPQKHLLMIYPLYSGPHRHPRPRSLLRSRMGSRRLLRRMRAHHPFPHPFPIWTQKPELTLYITTHRASPTKSPPSI